VYVSEIQLDRVIPQLPSGDLAKTADFFNELGFETHWLSEENRMLILKRSHVELHFWKTDNEAEAQKLGRVSSCYIRSEQVSELFKEFKERGVKFRYELKDQPWGMREMQIDDPYDNAIRFGSPI
jgi:predicted lactoylglutathione lyase